MIETVHSAEPTHFPMSMGKYGLNPFGNPLWRIVFADSVRHLIGGKWADGREEYRLAKFYTGKGAKGKWVLESWISAYEHTGCTAQEYVIKFQAPNCVTMIQNEPYPYEGTYVQRHIFSGEVAGVDELIAKWHRNRDVSFAERKRLIQEAYDYNAKKTQEEERYRLRDAQPDPCGLMMLSKQKSGLRSAKDFNLPKMGFGQFQGA